jgi:hypothetical protein
VHLSVVAACSVLLFLAWLLPNFDILLAGRDLMGPCGSPGTSGGDAMHKVNMATPPCHLHVLWLVLVLG